MSEPAKQPAEEEEEPMGLFPVRTGVTQAHLLQWIDPTFDEAEPSLEAWLAQARRAA